MTINLRHYHFDYNFFAEIKPFFNNVVETFKIILPDSFDNSDKENFQNKTAYALENELNLVSLFHSNKFDNQKSI